MRGINITVIVAIRGWISDDSRLAIDQTLSINSISLVSLASAHLCVARALRDCAIYYILYRLFVLFYGFAARLPLLPIPPCWRLFFCLSCLVLLFLSHCLFVVVVVVLFLFLSSRWSFGRCSSDRFLSSRSRTGLATTAYITEYG